MDGKLNDTYDMLWKLMDKLDDIRNVLYQVMEKLDENEWEEF